MKIKVLFFSVLFLIHLISAVEPVQDGFLPKWLTEEEKSRLHEIDYEREQTEPPAQPPRNVAEFEPMSAVLIRYPLGIPAALVALLSEEIEVITIVADQAVENQAINTYQSHGVNMDNCSFLIAGTNSFWTRDYGPWFIFNGDHEIGIVDFEYDRPRPLDNAIPGIFAGEDNINYYHMGLVHTGGDYMSDGMGIAASTEAAYSVNSANYTPAEVDSIMQLYLGIDDYHVVPNIHGGLSHIDTWGKFLAPDKIMIREVPPTHPYYNHAEQAVVYFESQISSYGTPFRVYRVYTPDNQPYTNSLIVNNRVFVPVSNTGSIWDDEAVQSFEEAMPGYTVYGVPYGYWGSTDALHCRVKEIADPGMLHIHHLPVIEDQQSHHDYEIQARIIPMSGEALYADSVRVYYRIDDDDFSYENMAPVGDYWYTANIPQQEIGSEISYYISAADESGRSENRPYTGHYDPHIFNVVGPLVFLGAEIDDSIYGNDNGFFEPGETVNIIAGFKNEGDHTINNLAAQLQTDSQFVTIIQPGQATHGSIAPQEEIEFSFIASASLACPSSYYAEFNLQVTTDEGYFSNNTFEIEVNAQFIIDEYFISEDFTEWLPLGWEVTSTSGQINWEQSSTNLAGGDVPEARFFWDPSTLATQRLITPSLDTSAYSVVALTFKHFIDNYEGGYTLKVETSGDGGDSWHEIMNFPDVNMPATTEEMIIDNEDAGSAEFRIAWTFEGDSWNINWWNIDDVAVGGVIDYDDLAFVEGEVTLNMGPASPSAVLISADEQITYPDEDGFYSLALFEGSYDIEASLNGYIPVTIPDVHISAGDTLSLNIDLEYLAPPVNLTFELNLPEVTLIWEEYEQVRLEERSGVERTARKNERSKTGNDSRSISYFNVYRSYEEEDFGVIGTTTEPEYIDSIEQDGFYQYYVTAVYDDQYESEPSNTVEIDPVETIEDLISMETHLRSNYPNPFNPQTTLEYFLPAQSEVKLIIYNIKGQKVKTLLDEHKETGEHRIVWDGKDERGRAVPSGVYLYRLVTEEKSIVRKMMLVK